MNQQDNKPSLISRILLIIGVVLLLVAAIILGYVFGRFVSEKCDLATVVKLINS